MDSNNQTENQITINDNNIDSNNSSIIMNIINETIESIEVPLNSNQSQSGSEEDESSPTLQMECNVNCDEMNDQKSSCEQLPECEPIDDNVDNDNKPLDTNDCQTDIETNLESVKDSRHQYSKEQLIAISKLSLARIRPQCLDNTFNNPANGLWDPEKWMSNKFASNGSAINSTVKYNYNKRERQTDGNENVSKKVNSDPRERVVEEEKDNIILSPQRGSFGTGCHVSTTCFVSNKIGGDARSRDHHQERAKIDDSGDGSHRTNSNHRRVGTGRILPKDRERGNDWMDSRYDRERNYDHRNDNRDNNRNDDYNERRKSRFSYDNNSRRGGNQTNSNRNNRYDTRDHYRHSKEEDDEPEWFTGGPTSKHETIELKGFDDEPEDRKKCFNDSFDEKSIDRRSSDKDFKSNIDNQNKRLPQKDINSSTNDSTQSKSELKARDEENVGKNDDFDVNDMFKMEDWFNADETPDNKLISSMDVISNTATNDCDNNTKSRFKQWFKESPTNAQMGHFNDNSQNDVRNAFKDKHSNISQSDQRSNSSTHRSMPSTHQQSIPNISESNNEKNIFDLLQGANRLISLDHLIDQKKHKQFDPSKAKNVSEIEASLKQLEISNTSDGDQQNDKIAFEKLINELGKRSSTNPVYYERANNIVDKQTETIILPTSNSNIVVPKEQQQPRSAPTILELLKEDENQDAFEALANSQVRYWKQEPNSSMSQLNSSSAFNVNNINMVANYANTANALPQQNWQNTTQPLTNSMAQRMHSPQELAEHTQNIFRNAMIQRRDERDKGVRAENTRNVTPTKGMNNSKYSSFTPTSVILKMHSDKGKSGASFDDMTGDVQTSQQKFMTDQLMNSSKPSNSPRPIVKSNNPFGQQIPNKMPVMSQTNTLQFNANSDNSFNKFFDKQQQQMLIQQQLQQQSLQSSQQASKAQRPLNSSPMPSMPTVRSVGSPLNLATLQSGVMVRPSNPSPNANNNMQTPSIRNINQVFNNSNIRPNSMTQFQQINQLMAIQQRQQQQLSAPNDSRHLQYSQSRPMNSMNIQQMLFKNSNAANNQTLSNPSGIGISGASNVQNICRSDYNQYSVPFNNPMDRNVVSNMDQLKTSTTYQDSRPQLFRSSGSADPRNLGQWFGNEMLNQKIADMPAVPLQNALTLEDLERP